MARNVSARGRWKHMLLVPVGGLLLTLGGCLSVKTEHEIKPIHITMDINLKVDRELDAFFSDIDEPAKARE